MKRFEEVTAPKPMQRYNKVLNYQRKTLRNVLIFTIFNLLRMETNIKERVLAFIKYKGLKMKVFENQCGLSSGYITSMRKGFGSEKLNNVLTQFPELNREWLLYGEGEMLNQPTNEKEVSEKEKPNGLPLIPIEAMAGVLSGMDTSVMEYDCERYHVPLFTGADFLIRIQGDSMMPKYVPGNIVACKRVPLDKLWFQWGKVYVIDTRQGALIKRIEPSSEGFISLCSDNPSYKPFDLPVDEINGVALVIGQIGLE